MDRGSGGGGRNEEKKTSDDDVEEGKKPGKAPVKYAQEAGFGQER